MRRRLSAQKRSNTRPELQLRRRLFKAGLRYRVDHRVPDLSRRTIDIAFTGQRVAVFVDGCFWHGCSQHFVPPRSNAEWWATKIDSNRVRDHETTLHLEARGWTVVRLWEHELPDAMCSIVLAELNRRR